MVRLLNIVIYLIPIVGNNAVTAEELQLIREGMSDKWNKSFPNYTIEVHVKEPSILEANRIDMYNGFDTLYQASAEFGCKYKTICLYVNPPLLMNGREYYGGLAYPRSYANPYRSRPVGAIWTRTGHSGLSTILGLHEIGHTVGMRHRPTESIMNKNLGVYKSTIEKLMFDSRSKSEFRGYMRRWNSQERH